MLTLVIVALLGLSLSANADYGWREGEALPLEGLPNPYGLSELDLAAATRAGRYHALNYPVDVTGALLPVRPIQNMMDGTFDDPFRNFLEELFRRRFPFKNFDQFMAWMGLPRYPETEGEGPYLVPRTKRAEDSFAFARDADFERTGTERMGLTIKLKGKAQGFTYSCAVCHSSVLFGRPVIGLQNRFPRANRVYEMGDRALERMPTPIFGALTKATKSEAQLYRSTRKNMNFVETKIPMALGLDTSLAHVALSLSHRSLDPWASKTPQSPRREPLRTLRGDSKPGTWWNVKYKNKWLLDGSVVSGNPIFTNILWNEIGRATDLKELKAWLDSNQPVIRELTTAVYNSTAPHITDFFPAERFDLDQVKRGQEIYKQMNCNKCHGSYIKNYQLPDAPHWPLVTQLKTGKVEYFADTPVKDVGTDPARYQAMASLVQLNDLRISQLAGAKVRTQIGYVPPPLEGIWARWPYLHNNSVPSLCELFTPEDQRVKFYWAGEPTDTQKDFDFDCNGYPVGKNTPLAWKDNPEQLYQATVLGRLNVGHSDRILVKDGAERMTPQERRDLIRFLQTL